MVVVGSSVLVLGGGGGGRSGDVRHRRCWTAPLRRCSTVAGSSSWGAAWISSDERDTTDGERLAGGGGGGGGGTQQVDGLSADRFFIDGAAGPPLQCWPGWGIFCAPVYTGSSGALATISFAVIMDVAAE